MRQLSKTRFVLIPLIILCISLMAPLSPLAHANYDTSITQNSQIGDTTPTLTEQTNTQPTNTDANNLNSSNINKVESTPSLSIDNSLSTASTSGNVEGSKTETIGNVSSGGSTSNATQINIVGTEKQIDAGPKISTFNTTYEGNVNEDLNIDLYHLLTSPSSSTAKSVSIACCSQDNIELVNKISASSQSGNLDLSENKNVGDTKSGNAVANANLINLIDSEFNNGQLFIGQINIQGNLTGDILLPADFMQGLKQSKLTTSNSKVDESVKLINDINMTSSSGNITAAENTKIGSLKSGNTSNIHNDYSLSNASIQGENALLLFVNITGEWKGGIINNPGSANSLLVGSITTDNNITGSSLLKNMTINNLVDVNSMSGNINLIKNGEVGNVKSGDAISIANIANLMGTKFSLNKYFGILFINIIGDWHGSFGLNTPYGNPVSTPPTGTVGDSSNDSNTILVNVQAGNPPLSEADTLPKRENLFNNIETFQQVAIPNNNLHKKVFNLDNSDKYMVSTPSSKKDNHEANWIMSALGGVGGITLVSMMGNDRFKKYRK